MNKHNHNVGVFPKTEEEGWEFVIKEKKTGTFFGSGQGQHRAQVNRPHAGEGIFQEPGRYPSRTCMHGEASSKEYWVGTM